MYFLLTGTASGPFYYVIVLMQFTIMAPYLVKHRRNWMYLVTPVYLIFIYIYNIKTGSVWSLYGTLFPAWFTFYILGMDCRSGKFDHIIKRAGVRWIIASILLSLIEVWLLQYLKCSESFVVSQITFSSFLYATALLFWIQKKNYDMKKI